MTVLQKQGVADQGTFSCSRRSGFANGINKAEALLVSGFNFIGKIFLQSSSLLLSLGVALLLGGTLAASL
jgi:hypothetical protein